MSEYENSNEYQASTIAYDAGPLRERDMAEAGSFTMYSYNRFSYLIIEGMALQMLNEGCTEEQIKEVLASKHIRWMLDSQEDRLKEFGQQLAAEYEMAKVAKEMTP